MLSDQQNKNVATNKKNVAQQSSQWMILFRELDITHYETHFVTDAFISIQNTSRGIFRSLCVLYCCCRHDNLCSAHMTRTAFLVSDISL